MPSGITTTDRSAIWRVVPILALVAVVVILGVIYIGNRQNQPTIGDAEAEAAAVMDDVHSSNFASLAARFRSPYPPGPRELYEACKAVAADEQKIEVVEGHEFQPPAFRVHVTSDVADGATESCDFRLIRLNGAWDLRFP